jgi:GNAT superfamily N-acetyltransferase
METFGYASERIAVPTVSNLRPFIAMNITICEATVEHARDIAALTTELGYAANEFQTKEWLDYLLSSENHSVIVAMNDAKSVCGWVVIERRMSLETGFKAEITGLVVSEKYRRFGVGKKLVSSAAGWAKDLGLTKVVVRSNVKREESHVFYQNIGFTFKKTAHNYELAL